MKQEPAPFWASVRNVTKNKIDSQQHRTRLEDLVLTYLRKTNIRIYAGDSNAVFTNEDSRKLLNHLKNKLRTLEYIYLLTFLIKGLEAGKSVYGWPQVCVPSMPILARRERARFTPLSFRNLNNLSPYHIAIMECLEREPDDNHSRHLGLILLASIMYGGLLSDHWLTPLLRALPERVRMVNGLMWVDMQRPYVYPKFADELEKTKYVNRRWFPDPLTQSLIIRLHLCFPEYLPSCLKLDAENCLKTVLHGLSGLSAPLSIRKLMEAASCYLGLRIPGFLVSYATCHSVSVSVPPHVWTRLISDKSVSKDQNMDDDSGEDLPRLQTTVNDNDNLDMQKQETLRKQLTSLLGDARRNRHTWKPTRESIQRFFDDHLHELAPIMQMLTQWSIELLSRIPNRIHGRKRRTALQPSSVATYLQSIDQELLACAGTYNITLFDPMELRDLYDDAIKAAKGTKQKQRTSFRLTQFHHFLMRNYGVPLIDMDGMVGRRGPVELGVDANLVSPAHFRLVLRVLGWELPQKSRSQTICCLTLILGYRCGLRRSEALCLKIADLMGEKVPEVIIRTSSHFRPKTTDSTRRIPVWLLLEPDELAALMHWKQLRIAEQNDENVLSAFLFGMSGRIILPNDGDIFTPIQTALRQITGDVTSTYHHLRHSFANRMLIMLLPDDFFCEPIPELLKEMRVDQKTRKKIIESLFGNMDQGRQFLYGLTALLGHAEPSITMQSYIHLTDILLGQSVRSDAMQPTLSARAIMQITGIKRAMAFRTKAENHQEEWKMGTFIDRFSIHASKLFPDPLEENVVNTLTIQPEFNTAAAPTLPDWKIITHSLRQHQVCGKSPDEIATTLQLPADIVASWCARAEYIQNMLTKEGTPQHLTAWKRKRVLEVGEVYLFPEPPDSPVDKSLAASIFKKVSSLGVDKLDTVRTGCRIFVDRYSSNQGYARFTDFQGAIEFKEFLTILGIPDSKIFVSMFTRSTPPKTKELEVQQLVLKRLGISEDHLIHSGKRHVKYRRSHECSVGFIVGRGDRTIMRKGKQVAVETLYGFRYAIYMLSIGLGFEVETNPIH